VDAATPLAVIYVYEFRFKRFLPSFPLGPNAAVLPLPHLVLPPSTMYATVTLSPPTFPYCTPFSPARNGTNLLPLSEEKIPGDAATSLFVTSLSLRLLFLLHFSAGRLHFVFSFSPPQMQLQFFVPQHPHTFLVFSLWTFLTPCSCLLLFSASGKSIPFPSTGHLLGRTATYVSLPSYFFFAPPVAPFIIPPPIHFLLALPSFFPKAYYVRPL